MEFFISQTGEIYTGDLQPGDRIATGEQVQRHLYPPRTHDELWQSIKVMRGERQAGGIRLVWNETVYWFNSDEASRRQHMALAMRGEALTPGLQWKTLLNDFVTMTPALAAALVEAGSLHEEAVFTAAEMHRTAMLALEDPSAYDFSAGWPQTCDEWLAGQNQHPGTAGCVTGVAASFDALAVPASPASPTADASGEALNAASSEGEVPEESAVLRARAAATSVNVALSALLGSKGVAAP